MQPLQIKKMREHAAVPVRSTAGSAGLDLAACLEKPVTIAPGERALIPSGIAVGLLEDTVGLVFARSGLSVKKGIALANGVGVIDSDYTGEILVGLLNTSKEAYTGIALAGGRGGGTKRYPARRRRIWFHRPDLRENS